MSKSRYRNLMIIGNGFDRWQGFPTSYDEFRKYYSAHIDDAMDALGIPKKTFAKPGETEKTMTPVELVYGDPFDPSKLPSEFFWSFETSLDKIDDQLLNMYFGREKEGIRAMKETVKQAHAILRHLFSGWILDLDITPKDSGYRFKDDCFFINFNYTDTLEKRFGVSERNIYHIHGDAKHPESIIFGHTTHPETALKELIEHHLIRPVIPGNRLPRLEGLYAVEDMLYQTDKHVVDNIDLMCKMFMDTGLHIEDIENIYVFGHSFGDPDVEYFDYLDKVTRCGYDYDSLSSAAKLDIGKFARIISSEEEESEDYLMEEIHLNILYATHHRERELKKPPVPFPFLEEMEKAVFGEDELYNSSIADAAKRSVHQRFLLEQSRRTQDMVNAIARKRGLRKAPDGCHSVLGLADYLDGGHDQRRKNAQWHISYFTQNDKKQIERVMKRIGLKRYHLYASIDQCIEAYIHNSFM